MSDAALSAKAEALLTAALAGVFGWPDGSPLRRAVLDARDRIGRPMRVALAGLVKAGKSTLVNALFRRRLVATGADETTFNVNWLSYGETPVLEIDFKDAADRACATRPFATTEELIAELDTLTRRQSGNAALASIRHIRARFPHDLLRVFEVIDTPGLESVFGTDAENTRSFLGMRDRERTEVTRTEATAADAVLYLFKGNVGAADLLSLGELNDPALAGATPLNALGALTMADTFWPAESDPLAHARTIVRNRHTDQPQLGETFYTVLPVAGECALGAATLTAPEGATLRALATVPADRLRYFLGSHTRFCDRDDPELPDLQARCAVWDRLGRWGVWRACELLRAGTDPAELADRLDEASGVRELRRLLTAHFGRRARLLQVYRVCHDVIRACGQEASGHDPRRRAVALETAAAFEKLWLEEPAFDALRLLGRLYAGRLEVTEEERRDVLAACGEAGDEIAHLLGADPGTSREELRALAERKRRYWHVRAGDQLAEPLYKDAARVLAAIYARLCNLLSGDEPRGPRE